jgi:hypothetical protein
VVPRPGRRAPGTWLRVYAMTHPGNQSVRAIDARGHLERLMGETIFTIGHERPNRILSIAGDSVIVATEKSPDGHAVPVGWVQAALNRLLRDGEVEVSVRSVGYRSAFIGAVLATVPGTEVLTRPLRVRLAGPGPTQGA